MRLFKSKKGFAEFMKRGFNNMSGELRVDKDDLPIKQARVLPESRYAGECFVTLKTGTDSLGIQGQRYLNQLAETAKMPISFENLTRGTNNEFLISVLRNRKALYIEPSTDPAKKIGYQSLRNELDLYATVSKFYTMDGFNCRFPGANIITISQNNLGHYSKLEYEPVPDLVETLRVTSEESIERFMRFAFNKARELCRQKVTIAHKERDQLKYDGLFLNIARCIHENEFCDLEFEDENIDTLACNLVQCPNDYDVIISNEQYGTIVTALCATVCGGVGLYSATEMGDSHALFVPLQTKLSVNWPLELSPYSLVMCLFDLLEHSGHCDCAADLLCEMFSSMYCGIKTAEFGGTDSGSYVICTICNNLKCKFP